MNKKIENSKKVFNVLMWLPIIVTLVLLPFMPDKMPLHAGLSGEIDSMASKYTTIILSVIVILMGLLFKYIIKREAKKDTEVENAITRNEKPLITNGITTLILLNVVSFVFIYKGFVLASSNNNLPDVNITQITNIILAVILIIMGNILPKTKMNSFIGVRTPWSRANEESWAISQRIGGKIFVVVGIISLIGSIFISKDSGMLFTLACLIVGGILIVIGSYRAYEKTLKR